MGIVDKFKDLFGIEEYDEEEEYEETPKPAPKSMERKSVERYSAPKQESRGDSKVIPMQGKAAVERLTNAFKMVVIEPSAFEECPKLVDSLKSRKPIIINLEKVESDTARKIFDFLSGATYALNGNVHKVANNIFVFAPENVDIMGSVDDKSFSLDNGKKNYNPWQ